ncbi:MAG TPA: DUF1800 family protein [Verrucomicrobiae bacterium]|jgi:uncharacterized protein (DUF1800 family)|nr:DUF1800 family protein [Verrucomicrobiae bacterium]
MIASFLIRPPVRCCGILLIVTLFAAISSRAQILDQNANGMSDVWEIANNAEGVDPDADSDGDGVPNRLEAIAGTNPFDARSVPRILPITVSSNGVRVTMNGALGKRYELQACEAVCGSMGTNWFTETSLIARTDTLVVLNAPANLSMKFFRVSISDVDTDGDGLSDWEEYQLGTDPFSANSNGKTDSSGHALGDLAYARQMLAPAMSRQQSAVAESAPMNSALIIYPKAGSTGAGLTGYYYTNSSATYTNPANFNPANLFLTTNDSMINFSWGPATTPNLSNGFYTVRWNGQVEPQYSETYVFETRTDDGAKLWVNDQLLVDKWQVQGTTSWTNTITLQAGVRYNLRMEYFTRGNSARAQLYWYSLSQPRQIIPATQLYPAADGLAPGAITSPTNAIAFLGQPFNYTTTAANSPLSFGATNLPPGLGANPTNGLISGIPTLAGGFDIFLFATNAAGVGNATLHLTVFDTGSAVTREVWTNVPGTNIASIPINTPAPITNSLGALEGVANFGDNYAERIRGYLTAPATGNYYFWLAANSSAELWIANDDQPATKVRRVTVTSPTGQQQWNLQPKQRSGWLSLQAGNRYYFEILHKAGAGTNDHWSVGWLLDPYGTNTTPSGVVPGFVLSPFTNPPAGSAPGTLFSANLLAQSGALSSGVGSATLRLSADETYAVLRFNYSGLSSPKTAEHIHADTYLAKNSQGLIVFDIDATPQQPDGSYIWNLAPVAGLTTADLVEIVKEGKAYLNVHTVNYPGGEINGHFALAAGTPTFTPPPPPPTWTDDHANTNAAARFLAQATFGPNPIEMKNVTSQGYDTWINKQFALPVSSHLTNILAQIKANPNAQYDGTVTFDTWWQQSVSAPDQLRQRVAFALSEIMVVSENGVLMGNPRALSGYYDTLLKDSFGNFRTLLEDVTLSPTMGDYLDMRRNDKANVSAGTHPNENYAREVMQLFSIGLNRMWPDGTLILNSQGDIIPTYDQNVIIGYARVFTGWNYFQTNQANGRLPNNWNPTTDYLHPMVLVPTHHEPGTKQLLDNVVLPAAFGAQIIVTNAAYDAYGSQDLELGLDAIFNNENVGPFICRQLIQRLVTSHPSREYLYRVVQKFDDNGAGVRGDMKAVIKAILLDYEARSPDLLSVPTFGKLREPLLRVTTIARALPAPAQLTAKYSQKGSSVITVTTSKAHRLSSSDQVSLLFSGKLAPPSGTYRVPVTGANTFTLTAQGLATGTYGQSGTTITVTNSGHGLSAGYQLYLDFVTKGAKSGIYTVTSVVNGSVFTVTAAKAGTSAGSCLFPKWVNGDFQQSSNIITLSTTAAHGLKPKGKVYIVFPSGNSPNGVYQVSSVPTPDTFTVTSSVAGNNNDFNPLVLPLVVPPLARSGAVTVQYNSWGMGYTDSGSSSSLNQTPLDSPTVFNFYFPDYKFQGILASAGLTTPEFQLTSDTSTVLQMNFISSAVFNNGGNTNGLSSFASGNGSVTLDLGPWMTSSLTSDAGIPTLIDQLNTQLCAGQLSPAAKTLFVSYVANARFPYTTPTPTFTQMRDRVRAVVHLITASPEFNIQR